MSRFRIVAALLLSTAVLIPCTAFGNTSFWHGTVDNRWSVAANWQGGVLPAAGDDLEFYGTAGTLVNDLPAGMTFHQLRFTVDQGFVLTGNAIRLTGGIENYTWRSPLPNEVAFDLVVNDPIVVKGNLIVSGSISGAGSIDAETEPLIRFTGNSPFSGTLYCNYNGHASLSSGVSIDGAMPATTVQLMQAVLLGNGSVGDLHIGPVGWLYYESSATGQPIPHLRAATVKHDGLCPLSQPTCGGAINATFELVDATHYATLTATGTADVAMPFRILTDNPSTILPGQQFDLIRSGGIIEDRSARNGVPRETSWFSVFPYAIDFAANGGKDVVITRRSWPGAFQGPQSTAPDILWRNEVTGANAVWQMGGVNDPTTVKSVVNLPGLPNTDYRIAGTADFDGDGNSDILWWNRTTGAMALWMMNGTNVSSIVNLPGIPNVNIQPVGVGDFNFDGMPEIVFHNRTTGLVSLWLMNGTSFSSIVNMNFTVDPAVYRIVGVVNTSGPTYLVLQSGQDIKYLATLRYNLTSPMGPILTLAAGEEVGGAGSFHRSSTFELVIRNPASGANRMESSGSFQLPSVNIAAWHIVGPR